MVVIQVMLGLVRLTNDEELGVELGLQDSLLFDRGVGLGTDAALAPGYLFNNFPLGNSGSATSLATREAVGQQGLSNFALGRTNAELGYGGFVFSASSESVSVLVRAAPPSRPGVLQVHLPVGSTFLSWAWATAPRARRMHTPSRRTDDSELIIVCWCCLV